MQLDHVNIRVTELEPVISLFENIAGLRKGDRPPFKFDGAWLYDDTDRPVVHLVQTDAAATVTGSVDHFAFRGTDLPATRATLATHGYEYDERVTPGLGTVQLFVKTDLGISIELQFPPAS